MTKKKQSPAEPTVGNIILPAGPLPDHVVKELLRWCIRRALLRRKNRADAEKTARETEKAKQTPEAGSS